LKIVLQHNPTNNRHSSDGSARPFRADFVAKVGDEQLSNKKGHQLNPGKRNFESYCALALDLESILLARAR
jgi:hypothetical protein